jgi:hypothetical protein
MADKNYTKLVAYARAKDLIHDTRHLDGWKATKNAELRRLYIAGKVSPERGIAAKATAKDHIAAIKNGLDPIKLAECGIDLRKLAASEARMLGEVKAKPVRAEKVAQAKAPKTMVVIKSVSAKSVALKQVVAGPRLTATQSQAKALVMAYEREAAKMAESQAYRSEGFAPKLSQADIDRLTQTHKAKGAKIVIR